MDGSNGLPAITQEIARAVPQSNVRCRRVESKCDIKNRIVGLFMIRRQLRKARERRALDPRPTLESSPSIAAMTFELDGEILRLKRKFISVKLDRLEIPKSETVVIKGKRRKKLNLSSSRKWSPVPRKTQFAVFNEGKHAAADEESQIDESDDGLNSQTMTSADQESSSRDCQDSES